MARRRDLSADERALWERVAASARPLSRIAPRRHKPPQASPGEPVEAPPHPARKALAPLPRRPERPAPQPPAGLDRRTEQRLARGDLSIDARLDLHGMTQAAAHRALRGFLAEAQAAGRRIVLVITGKGGDPRERERTGDIFASAPRGILARQVPHWLEDPELRPYVAGFRLAHRRHGGSGALYVRLRRHRGA